ncbi:MAG: GNAT family N-acetyltransferase [Nannocystales bacterium]
MPAGPIEVTSEPRGMLEQYAEVSIAFEVHEVFDMGRGANGTPRLIEPARRLASSYRKDYDILDGGPIRWPERFDLSAWGLFGATIGGNRVGGAAVAVDPTGSLDLAEGRDDVALLWDLRVSDNARHQGVGSALFRAAERWAAMKGFRQLEVETQNNNVPACRFYERMGSVLRAANHGAYPELPDEVQLLWCKQLRGV